MGRTGVLTPTAVFEPIDMDGSMVERASLHNLSIMEETIGIPYYNQQIEVFKANMIIPQISKADKENGSDETIIHLPTVCPICGEKVEIECSNITKNLVCTNPNCEGKLINKIDHFASKKGLDIKGLSKATLEKLIDLDWVSNIKDIFTLEQHREAWVKLPGFGEKSVDKMLTAIKAASTTDFVSFLSALGIPLVGRAVAAEIEKTFPTYEEFRTAILEKFDFCQLDGFAEAKSAALLNFDYTEADEIYEKYVVIPTKEKITTSFTNCNDLKVVILVCCSPL
jgi:DNA ligase (NAD+)